MIRYITTMGGFTYCEDCMRDMQHDDPLDSNAELYTRVIHDPIKNPTTSPCDHCGFEQWEID